MHQVLFYKDLTVRASQRARVSGIASRASKHYLPRSASNVLEPMLHPDISPELQAAAGQIGGQLA